MFLTGKFRWINLSLASIAFGFIYSFNNLFIGLQIASRKRLLVSFNQFLMTFLKFLLAVLLITIFGASGTTAMYGQLIGLTIAFLIQIIIFPLNSIHEKNYYYSTTYKSFSQVCSKCVVDFH